MTEKLDIQVVKSSLQNEWFNINHNIKDYKYFFENMDKKLNYWFTEFGLAIKILMTKYKGLSDFFILSNYISIQIMAEINKIQQGFRYEDFRKYLMEALRFKAEFLYRDEYNRQRVIESNMALFDFFLGTESGIMDYYFDNLDKWYLERFKKVYAENIKWLDDDNIRIIAREQLIKFWQRINRALLTLYDGKEVATPLSLWFSLNIKWESEKRDYRIQADPVINFYWIRSRTYRLLATKIIDLEKLWYDEYVSLIKDKIWSQKLHIWCWTTNSGKSTSIISALDYMNKTKEKEGQKIKIYTMEDPIEKKTNFAYQLQVAYNHPNPDERITFTDGIKSSMRNSPRVIMVWEIRDLDTWVEALNAAISWHITISTIHTNTSFAVFQRLKNMKDPSWKWSWIALNDILSWLWLVITTNLLSTYPVEKTIKLKELVKAVEKNWKKTYLYLAKYAKWKDKISWKYYSESPIIDDFFYALIEYYKTKKKYWQVKELKWNYPLLYNLFNKFKKFASFYKNNVYIDYGNKLDIFSDFIKWFEYTMENHRIVYKKVDNKETWMKPVMEILNLEAEHIDLLQTAKGESEIYNWLAKNETTFLPRFYFAYLKNILLQKEKWMTFDFRDIVNLANIAYVFRI